MSESSNKARRQRTLDATLLQHVALRLVEVDTFNDYILDMERLDPSPMMPQRALEAVFRRSGIVHAVWDEPAAQQGLGTMLLKGDAAFLGIYAAGHDALTIFKRSHQVGELTIRVPDEGAARELRRLFGDGTATLRAGAVASMRFCIDRPRPDGTTFRQTVHAVAQA